MSTTAVDEARPLPRARAPRSAITTTGALLVGVVLVVATFGPLLAAHDPRDVSGPVLDRPSGAHWLGTDVPGRDLFAQLVHGARSSLSVAPIAGAIAMVGAVLVGVLPALLGRWPDAVSARVVVFILALPGLPLLVVIGSLTGESRWAVIAVIGFLGIAPNARILRSQTLTLRERGFIAAARGFGAGPTYVLRRHLVPGLGPLIVLGFVNWAGVSIGLEAGLSFLGLGDPTGVSWGLTLNRALTEQSIYFSDMWTWWVLPPGLAIAVTVLGFTFLGVGLEPRFNPRWLRAA
ncbi:MAG: ABC transporter permease [Acidimicrobiia bacterium]|nr:ABC transporter permease [Acidimicrobiia bacterium]